MGETASYILELVDCPGCSRKVKKAYLDKYRGDIKRLENVLTCQKCRNSRRACPCSCGREIDLINRRTYRVPVALLYKNFKYICPQCAKTQKGLERIDGRKKKAPKRKKTKITRKK